MKRSLLTRKGPRKKRAKSAKTLQRERAKAAKKLKREQEKKLKLEKTQHRRYILDLREKLTARKQARLAKLLEPMKPLALNIAKEIAQNLQERIALKLPVPKASALMGRRSDIKTKLVTDQVRILDELYQPEFDEAADARMNQIWGDDRWATCQATGKSYRDPVTGKIMKGLSKEHCFPTRGAYGNETETKTGGARGGGLRGSDSFWNIYGMCGRPHNSGLKRFNHKKDHGWSKDVAYQTLTSEEYEQCTDRERDYYDKLRQSREYTTSRGAHYAWKYTTESNLANEDFITVWFEMGRAMLPGVPQIER